MKYSKLFLVFVLTAMSLGFRLMDSSKHWEISSSDPYLWIKPCDRSSTFESNSVHLGDSLFDRNNINITSALQSIADNVNNIYGSYLRLEIYPEDPSNPPANSHFDYNKANRRTIDICSDSYFLASGMAAWKTDRNSIIGCDISYVKKDLRDARTFVSVLSHEIGHCLGLHHPQELTHSIMSYFKDTDYYRYQIDDFIGIRYLYPAHIEGIDQKENNSLGLSCKYK
ncbi:MAG: matrixin family metalloprotease [Oligoflexia bacterium]|nr:matrixin family metalloprotease [Oligoflexia bacterium]